MHFSVLVLIPPDTDNIKAKVEEILQPYYSELEVEPYKEYLSEAKIIEELNYLATLPAKEIEKMVADWEIPSYDLRTLAKMELGAKLGWFEEEADGIDSIGLYKMTTINPQGKWDYYRFIETEPLDSGTAITYPCRVADLPEVVPYAIVTPNGEWNELGEAVGIQAFLKELNGDITVSDEEIVWKNKLQEIIKYYSEYICVALRCHI
jgi:hypothetical protein